MAQRLADSFDTVTLAHTPPFRLGALQIHPATRQVSRDGRNETLEPRVMQVLVALAEAGGAILSRDDLLARCWGGRVVGENAIHRTISRIRHLADDLGQGSFEVETITKVGYRLNVDGAALPTHAAIPFEAAQSPGRTFDRRLVLGGVAAAVGIGAAATYVWNDAASAHEPSAAARELFRRGVAAQRQGLPDQAKQVVAYFEQAVEADPLYADAWGSLAIAYCYILDVHSDVKEETLAGLARSAARRALALDPDNGDAQAALVFVKPFYRNWSGAEGALRRLLARYPDHWLMHMQLSHILYQVGRWQDGIVESRRVLDLDPFLPMTNAILARALWSAGRLQEAESAIDSALARWPGYFLLWSTKYSMLAFGGRPAAAIAFVSDPDLQPTFGMSPTAVRERVLVARAIETRKPDDAAAALAAYRAQVLAQPASLPHAATVFAALGELDLAFQALDAYYFRRGRLAGPAPQPIGPLIRRSTDFLFMPPTAPLRLSHRFAALTQAIGLADYWRSTSTVPDYRR